MVDGSKAAMSGMTKVKQVAPASNIKRSKTDVGPHFTKKNHMPKAVPHADPYVRAHASEQVTAPTLRHLDLQDVKVQETMN